MKQAMIFAAGLGTRLKPLTDTMPKALVRVGGQPLLWHVIQRLKEAGFGRVVINVHHFAQQIIDYLQANQNFGLDIRISDETSGLLETGGGIRKALPLFDPELPVLIHNVDILSNADLAGIYAMAERGHADALLLVSPRHTKRYLLFEEEESTAGASGILLLQGWTNIETGEVRSPYPGLDPRRAQQLAFSGIHVLSPSAFSILKDMPERFGIIDFYLRYCHNHAFLGKNQRDLQLLDVGKLDSLDMAEAFLSIPNR